MKRQVQNVRTMIYAYGTVPARVAPVVGESDALAQIRLANQLRNVLVSIDRVRMERFHRIMRDEAQEQIDQLKERKDQLFQQVRDLRKAARKKVPIPPEIADEQKRVSAALKMLVEHQKETKAARLAARKPELEKLGEATKRRIKKARQAAAHMGLFWGTYNAIVQGAETSRKQGKLNYHRYREEGTVTAQIQGGISPEDALGGTHGFFRLERQLKGRKWRYACVRIGSTPKTLEPIWLKIPIVLHRPMPEEGRIKSVSATRRIVAGQVRWQLNVTVTQPPVGRKETGHAIAFDLGWRKVPAIRQMPEGTRVAYWQDEQGGHGQIVVSQSDLGQLEKIRDLQSICDKHRDVFLPQLTAWLSLRKSLPEAWQQRTVALAQWRSSDRIAALVRWWSDNRLRGDEEIYDEARQWRKQYLHLSSWWRNLQDQMTLRLREQYRVFAAGVAEKYGMLILEEFDLREVAEIKPEETRTASARSRQQVSPSMFRAALLNACRREGLEVRIVPSAYTTSTCHNCHQVEVWDQAADIMHRCGHCGELWDQDHNAAINLLASGLAMPAQGEEDGEGIPPDSGDLPGMEVMGTTA